MLCISNVILYGMLTSVYTYVKPAYMGLSQRKLTACVAVLSLGVYLGLSYYDSVYN